MIRRAPRLVGWRGGLAIAAIGVPLTAALVYAFSISGQATVAADLNSATRAAGSASASATTARRGNPLWATPVISLTATRERPVFAPSRRAPPVFQLASVPPPSPVVAGPGRPLLALVGVIVGGADGIAIFRDETTKGAVRLRTGERHAGWTLRSITSREATFEKGRDVATVSLLHQVAK
jgi:hypothetical protein